MEEVEFVWQCKCGHVEHGDLPEDCPNCLSLNSFKRIQEDQIKDAVDEAVLSMRTEEEDED
ncbi:MAG: hypothetical protein ABIG28_03570 [archaeon]